MKLSLIMATVGRTKETSRFLASLDAQTHKDFELIVVDQNPDDRLVPVLDPYRARFPIFHLRSEEGVSRARNAGLGHVGGEVAGFPDDDCWYPPRLLEQTARFLGEHPNIDGVTGRAETESGADFARFDPKSGFVSLYNVSRRASTACTFVRSRVVEKVGGFDETLGPGSGTIFGAGEDTDYVPRAVEAGCEVYYDTVLAVLHPDAFGSGYGKVAGRAYDYGAGFGRLWRKHGFPIWLVSYYLLRPLGGVFLSLAVGEEDRAYYYWRSFRGRLRGWLLG